MDVTALTLFVDVVRRGSFAAVARERGVDPSSVSRAVAALEAELGLRLFQRTTRRLAPTEAGAAYFARVEPLVEELDAARLQAADAARRPTGTLRVSAPVSFALLNLVPLLPAFAACYPEVAVDLVLADARLDLVEERLDAAVRLGTLPDLGLGDAVVVRRLAPMVFRACASPTYLARRGRPAVPADLAAHDCLALDVVGFTDRWRFRGPDGTPTTVRARGPLRTSNALALKAAALAGLGVIVQARWIVGRELRDGTLVDLFPDHAVTAAAPGGEPAADRVAGSATGDDADGEASAWLVYPTRAYVPRKVRAFVDHVVRAFAAGPPGDAVTPTGTEYGGHASLRGSISGR